MDLVAENLYAEDGVHGAAGRKDCQLFLVPRRSAACEQRLRDKGVWDSLTAVEQLTVDLYPLESDVVSMEDERLFRQLYVDGDTSGLYGVARALITLQVSPFLHRVSFVSTCSIVFHRSSLSFLSVRTEEETGQLEYYLFQIQPKRKLLSGKVVQSAKPSKNPVKSGDQYVLPSNVLPKLDC